MAAMAGFTKDILSDVTADAVFDEDILRNVTHDQFAEAPSGYSVSWITDEIDGDNEEIAEFEIVGGRIDDFYTYTITSSAGGTPVSGSARISADPEIVDDLDVSDLGDGTLTVTVVLSRDGKSGTAVTDTAVKDTAE